MLGFFKRFAYKSSVFSGNNKSTREVSKVNNINYEELLNKTKSGAVLIDVRTKQEFLGKHLNGAILIPHFEINKKIEKLVPNKNVDIVLYCQSGGRSLKAYDTLERMGYKNIYNLKGGIEEI